MVQMRPGFHHVSIQLPQVVWAALCEEAAEKDMSVGKMLTDVLAKRYKIGPGRIPPPRRPGRKPKSAP